MVEPAEAATDPEGKSGSQGSYGEIFKMSNSQRYKSQAHQKPEKFREVLQKFRSNRARANPGCRHILFIKVFRSASMHGELKEITRKGLKKQCERVSPNGKAASERELTRLLSKAQ